MTPPIDRLRPRTRPSGFNAGTQSWRDLLFVHWTLPVDVVRAAVPASMELDLFEGRALVGVVPFVADRPREPVRASSPPRRGAHHGHRTLIRSHA